MTEAIVVALRERLERERNRRGIGVADRLRRLAADVRSLPVLDGRSADEVIGYDDRGLPA